ncbi:universal stress protein [Herbaspirillum sp. HC18]|nr:universal stress protein [Herbaspirillum sp. HC18]
MFKTILVPTDGSPLSDKAIDAAVAFARGAGSKLIGISVAEPRHIIDMSGESTVREADDHARELLGTAQNHVDKIERAARAASVACETMVAQSIHPYREIINAAKEFGCDAIFMASHGRKGLSALFVGSETQKVLSHSTVPVLVLR